MLERFVCRGDCVVNEGDDLVKLFVLLLFYSEWRGGYLNSGILEVLLAALVFLRMLVGCRSSVGDLTGTGLMMYSVLDLERLGMYFSCVFFLMACSSSCRMLNFLNCECEDIQI